MQYSVTSDCKIVLVQGRPCVSRIYEAKINVTNLSSINSILHNFHPSLKSSLKNNNNDYEVSAFLFPQDHPDQLSLEFLLSYYFSGHPLFRAIKIFLLISPLYIYYYIMIGLSHFDIFHTLLRFAPASVLTNLITNVHRAFPLSLHSFQINSKNKINFHN